MAGYSGNQSTSSQQEYANLEQSKKDILNTLTKAPDTNAEQKQTFINETTSKVTNIEKQMHEELKTNLLTWSFILPANITLWGNRPCHYGVGFFL